MECKRKARKMGRKTGSEINKYIFDVLILDLSLILRFELLVEVSCNGDGALCALYAGIRTPNPNSLVGRGGGAFIQRSKPVRSNPALRIATIKFGL